VNIVDGIKLRNDIDCPQGMMVYLIGSPDLVKNKILASFAPLRFNLSSYFFTARFAQDAKDAKKTFYRIGTKSVTQVIILLIML